MGLEWVDSSDYSIPQGSPLLPILYIFYIANVYKLLQSESTISVGWINNTTLWTWSKSIESAVAQANSLLSCLPAWARVP